MREKIIDPLLENRTLIVSGSGGLILYQGFLLFVYGTGGIYVILATRELCSLLWPIILVIGLLVLLLGIKVDLLISQVLIVILNMIHAIVNIYGIIVIVPTASVVPNLYTFAPFIVLNCFIIGFVVFLKLATKKVINEVRMD